MSEVSWCSGESKTPVLVGLRDGEYTQGRCLPLHWSGVRLCDAGGTVCVYVGGARTWDVTRLGESRDMLFLHLGLCGPMCPTVYVCEAARVFYFTLLGLCARPRVRGRGQKTIAERYVHYNFVSCTYSSLVSLFSSALPRLPARHNARMQTNFRETLVVSPSHLERAHGGGGARACAESHIITL